MKKIFTYLFPQTIYTTSSTYNNRISVKEFRHIRSLYVEGIQQTGPYVTEIFDEAFLHFNIASFPINHALILGVGGGYIFHKLGSLFPAVTIHGVDIDQEMISIGKRFFGLEPMKNVTYDVQDAEHFVETHAKNKRKYDFIFIDLYIGDDVPDFFTKKSFFNNVRSLLSTRGIVLLNYQGAPNYRSKQKKLLELLSSVFTSVRQVHIQRNLFLLIKK